MEFSQIISIVHNLVVYVQVILKWMRLLLLVGSFNSKCFIIEIIHITNYFLKLILGASLKVIIFLLYFTLNYTNFVKVWSFRCTKLLVIKSFLQFLHFKCFYLPTFKKCSILSPFPQHFVTLNQNILFNIIIL